MCSHGPDCELPWAVHDWSDEAFLSEHAKHETAPRTTCSECHFESSEGYPPSHAPGCSRDDVR